MIRLFVLSLVITLPLVAIARPTSPDDCNTTTPDIVEQAQALMEVTEVPGGCADASKLRGICDDVYKNFEAEPPFRYQYEEKIHAAACADPASDSKEVVRQKIQSMWVKLDDSLKCDKSNFDVQDGSILKYSIKMHNFRFLAQAVQSWRVNINNVDPSDGRTVLDYIESEIQRNRGTETEQSLKTYRRILIEAGAKRSSEL